MSSKLLFSILLVLSILVFPAFSQNVDCNAEDKEIFKQYVDCIEPFRSEPKELILQKTAEFFLEKPYVGKTLEKNDVEKLVVNLREFDCVTFVETVIALANTVVSGDLLFDNFASHLQRIRYRDGVLNGYNSRLHYTSDWMHNNREKNILLPLDKELGCILEVKTIDFMSSHRSAYKPLKNDDSMLCKIKEMEKEINLRGGFYYLPKEKIELQASQIPRMAAIAFTTSIKGLDTTHVGFSYKKNGTLTFIHASSGKKKVVVAEKSLSDYCASQKSCTGILVAVVL